MLVNNKKQNKQKQNKNVGKYTINKKTYFESAAKWLKRQNRTKWIALN